MKKVFATWKGIQKGQKFKVISNSNSHSYPMNVVLTLKRDGYSGTGMDDACVEMHGNTLNVRDIELVPMCIEDLKADRNEILNYRKAELKELDDMIDFCTKYGVERYDPKMMYAHKIVEATKNTTMSDYDKMVAICKIMQD